MKKRRRSFPVKSALLLGASAVLLLGSTVGSTRAALTYYSENYTAQFQTSSIGVSLLENGEMVSHRDYQDDGTWAESGTGTLLGGMLSEGEKLVPGKEYDEVLSVENSGNIDTFVRVILTKSWQDGNGKNTTLSPGLIDLNLLAADGWVIDQAASTEERTVLYYTNLLPAGETTPAISDTIKVDNEIANHVTKQTDGNRITYVYDYDGYTFNVDAEVDAVQTHNAQAAIKSAWGRDVTVSADETSISLQ